MFVHKRILYVKNCLKVIHKSYSICFVKKILIINKNHCISKLEKFGGSRRKRCQCLYNLILQTMPILF